MVAVNPGTLMNALSIADIKVETAGEPNTACQKFTKSAAESNHIAADADWFVPPAVAVDRVLKSTIHSPVRKSRLP